MPPGFRLPGEFVKSYPELMGVAMPNRVCGTREGVIKCGCGWMQGLVGLDLRAGRGATMSRARFEVAVGPEARPCQRSLEPHPLLITPHACRADFCLPSGANSFNRGKWEGRPPGRTEQRRSRESCECPIAGDLNRHPSFLLQPSLQPADAILLPGDAVLHAEAMAAILVDMAFERDSRLA